MIDTLCFSVCVAQLCVLILMSWCFHRFSAARVLCICVQCRVSSGWPLIRRRVYAVMPPVTLTSQWHSRSVVSLTLCELCYMVFRTARRSYIVNFFLLCTHIRDSFYCSWTFSALTLIYLSRIWCCDTDFQHTLLQSPHTHVVHRSSARRSVPFLRRKRGRFRLLTRGGWDSERFDIY